MVMRPQGIKWFLEDEEAINSTIKYGGKTLRAA